MSFGWWLIASSTAIGLGTAFLLRIRASAWLVTGLLVAAGAGVATGGMILQPDPSVGEVVAAVIGLAVLVPAHVRIVLGPFGPGR